MVATDNEVLHAQLRGFFSEKLSVEISSVDANLIQTGILDSLALGELLAYIEKEFGTEISLELRTHHRNGRAAQHGRGCARSQQAHAD